MVRKIALAFLLSGMVSGVSGAGEEYMPLYGGPGYGEVRPGAGAPATARQSREPLRVNKVTLKLPSLGGKSESRLLLVDAHENGLDGSLNFSSARPAALTMQDPIPGMVAPEVLAMEKVNFGEPEAARSARSDRDAPDLSEFKLPDLPPLPELREFPEFSAPFADELTPEIPASQAGDTVGKVQFAAPFEKTIDQFTASQPQHGESGSAFIEPRPEAAAVSRIALPPAEVPEEYAAFYQEMSREQPSEARETLVESVRPDPDTTSSKPLRPNGIWTEPVTAGSLRPPSALKPVTDYSEAKPAAEILQPSAMEPVMASGAFYPVQPAAAVQDTVVWQPAGDTAAAWREPEPPAVRQSVPPEAIRARPSQDNVEKNIETRDRIGPAARSRTSPRMRAKNLTPMKELRNVLGPIYQQSDR